ncbi:MAG: hypothetical protein JJU29_05300 [Verrucomicrobia bacterium]|nr:hypothetical protein [Verrucomicrobiota bacterium]MCH8511768.1 hypothetical protein [Kiritimatiellia bacterium]
MHKTLAIDAMRHDQSLNEV